MLRRPQRTEAASMFQLMPFLVDLVTCGSDVGPQFIKVIPGTICIEELDFHVGGADTIIVAAFLTEIKAAGWLTKIPQSFFAAGLVGLQVGCNAMLRARLAMFPKTLGIVTLGAIFETDRLPITRQALVTTHRAAAAKAQQYGNCQNCCPFGIHVTPRK